MLLTFRRCHRRCSIKKDVLKNFTGNYLGQSLFLNKVAGLTLTDSDRVPRNGCYWTFKIGHNTKSYSKSYFVISLFPWDFFYKTYCNLTWSLFMHNHQNIESLFSLIFRYVLNTKKKKKNYNYIDTRKDVFHSYVTYWEFITLNLFRIEKIN